MKIFTKICLIPAAIFLAIGFPLMIVCGLLGGFSNAASLPTEFTQNNSFISRFIPYSALDKDHRAAALAKDIDGIDQASLEEMKEIDIQRGDELFKLAGSEVDITRMVLMTGLGNTSIDYSEDDCYYIRNQMSKARVKYSTEDGCLTVYVESSGTKYSDVGELEIFIPKDARQEEIVIHEAAGELNCINVSANKCKLFLEAGEANIDGASCDDLDIHVGEGELNLNDFKAKNIKADIDMGALYLNGVALDKSSIDASCDMGSITLMLNNAEDEFNIESHCSMGEVSINGKTSEGFGTNIKQDNAKDKNIKLDCDMGEIKVMFKGEKEI